MQKSTFSIIAQYYLKISTLQHFAVICMPNELNCIILDHAIYVFRQYIKLVILLFCFVGFVFNIISILLIYIISGSSKDTHFSLQQKFFIYCELFDVAGLSCEFVTCTKYSGNINFILCTYFLFALNADLFHFLVLHFRLIALVLSTTVLFSKFYYGKMDA